MTSTVDNSALLIMDVQDGIVERFGDEGVVDRIASALAAARERGMRVFFVRVAFREGHPEVSPHNRTFSALRGANAFIEDSVAIPPAVAPQPGEPIVTKRRVSAFAGSDLEVLLRAGEIRHLVLCGISTSGVVL